MRRAKIVCTLGPASQDEATIVNLIGVGMETARINFSHGEQAVHGEVIARVRAAAERCGRPVAVLQDLQGPKIRVGKFATGQTELEVGADFCITTDEVLGNDERVSTTYEHLPRDVSPGCVLLLDDGLLALEVQSVDGNDVHTRVTVGGTLKNNKGINLPGVRVSAPALTDKDKADLQFGIRCGVDFVALSFVRTPDDLFEARRLIRAAGASIPVIAKIERPEAVEMLELIVDAADGIMVARGDLGVELGAEKVPMVQKRAIELTNQRGKIVITATQMLESMIPNPRPTRAEASDVANAILDGTDAVMLSGETASGRYPLLAVRTMARIIEETESSDLWRTRFERQTLDLGNITSAVAGAAALTAKRLDVPAIACVSESGGAARMVSEHRPGARLIAFTSRREIWRQLALYWGTEPLLAPPPSNVDEALATLSRTLVERKIAKPGDQVVFTFALPLGQGQSTNTLHVHRVE